MRRDTRLVSALFVALATFTLNGCGADDSTSANAPSTSSPNVGEARVAATPAPLPAAAIPATSATLAANPALASDAITQNMHASLAADSQQVAPVMRYAPGDSATSN